LDPALQCAYDTGVATVTLNRPAARNALSQELRRTLPALLAELDADDGVRAIVLTGADPAFCAGVDLRELDGPPELNADLHPRDAPFVTCSTPLIGAVNGAAYTGGLELALACHFLIASDRARFADTHARLGLLPGWGCTVLLPEAVGVRRARQMSVTCEPIDAATALRWGLVNDVVAHEDLHRAASQLARSICANDTAAVRRVSALYDAQAAPRQAAAWRLESQAWLGTTPQGGPHRAP